jgi:hypothetical protein
MLNDVSQEGALCSEQKQAMDANGWLGVVLRYVQADREECGSGQRAPRVSNPFLSFVEELDAASEPAISVSDG